MHYSNSCTDILSEPPSSISRMIFIWWKCTRVGINAYNCVKKNVSELAGMSHDVFLPTVPGGGTVGLQIAFYLSLSPPHL